jgi:GH15 family glucan-1,4-alpha-glucosidase
MGVWVDGNFRWLSDVEWKRQLDYDHETLTSNVQLHHPDLGVTIHVNDAVDFHENLLVRRFDISNHANVIREVRIFLHHDFHISGNADGDTAYYEPERRAVLHYKDARWFMIDGAVELKDSDSGPGWQATADTAPGLVVGVHQWACGLKEIHDLQGTWRDAEDGQLSGNPVAHGSVDSTVGFSLHIPANETRTLYCWLAIASDFESVALINRLVRERGPQKFIERTAAYWRLWLGTHKSDLDGIPHEVCHQYYRSLLVVRTQIDNEGAIIAANDSDISSAVRDTYSYMWPRDGALVAEALTRAGYLDLPRAFFKFCDRVLSKEGYLLHKYNPDGTLASSWHPWYADGKKRLPIQEDETALPLWALGEHFKRFGDVAFIKPLYRHMIVPMAEFLADFRDPQSGLPQPSYDLWEERHGILSWSVAATWAGLNAAAYFAEAFGEADLALRYRSAADEIKRGTDEYLWQPEQKRFARMLNHGEDGHWQVDAAIDASLAGLWKFGMYAPDDPRIVSTMQQIKDRLWVKTGVGGVARYENDNYHQVSQDIQNVPGNPWFICTLWLAEYTAVGAKKLSDLEPALEILEWTARHALPSGVLAEQVNPYNDAPLSVSPLTWSHATYITAMQIYLDARKRLKA